MRGKGYTLTRAAQSYQKERLSRLARGGEQWRILEREILPEIGNVLLADLKPSQVMAAVVPMRRRAPRVAAMGISALRGVIRHARGMNRLDLDVADPTAGIPTIPKGKRNRALSDPEIRWLLRWLGSGAVSRTIVDILRLTLYTGARSGEVSAMRSRDVDIGAKTWTRTQGKTGNVSVTPLSAPAVEILRNRLGEEYVFPVRGRPVKQKALRGAASRHVVAQHGDGRRAAALVAESVLRMALRRAAGPAMSIFFAAPPACATDTAFPVPLQVDNAGDHHV